MIDRRRFLQSLAGLTAGILLPSPARPDAPAKPADRWGELLPMRVLGRTGEAVTMLGVGGNHIGRMSERDAEAAIEAAIEGGVRFFDTAASYQKGGSEQYLGKYLTPKYRDDIYLMTKTRARTAADAERDLEESLARLKTDHVDLWQMHSVTSPEDTNKRIEQGVLEVIVKAKESGKTRHVGFTGHFAPKAHKHVLEKTDIFDACQMAINVADPHYESFIEGVLPALVERKIGVLAMKTLANGGFFGASGHFKEPGENPQLVPNHVSVRDAIHFVWSLPVSVLITGSNNLEQLQEKISLARSFVKLDEKQRQELVARTSELAGPSLEFYKTTD